MPERPSRRAAQRSSIHGNPTSGAVLSLDPPQDARRSAGRLRQGLIADRRTPRISDGLFEGRAY